jgi:hypothetical protein
MRLNADNNKKLFFAGGECEVKKFPAGLDDRSAATKKFF